MLAGDAVKVPAVTAVPVTATFKVELDAVLVMARLPVIAPADCGANVTVIVVNWPAATVTGGVIPFKVRPLPVTAACEIETVEPPVLFNVTLNDCVLPTLTVPKARLVGFAASIPGVTPAPESAKLRFESEASLTKVKEPLALPKEDPRRPIPVPARVRPVNPAPAVKESPSGPSTPMEPIKSSLAKVVAAVEADEAAVPVPEEVLVWSSAATLDRPENSLALSALAVAEGWVTVMVFPPERAETL